jgi:hypothetical protein
MEDNNQWYKGIEKEITLLKEKMRKSDTQVYELDLLLRVATHVAGFSSRCENCQGHRNDISNLVTGLENLSKITREEVSDYDRTLRSLVEHLKKRHGLHRTFGLILPIAAVVVAPLLFMISLSLMSYGFGTDSYTPFVLGAIGLGIATIIGLVGVVLGIIRRSRKRI